MEINYDLMLLALAALFVDALFGSHRLLGRVPGPDSLIRVVLGAVIGGLSRRAVGTFVGWLLGAVVLAVAMATVAGLGHLIGRLDSIHPVAQLVQILLLALVLGQRAVVDTARHLATRLDAPSTQEAEGRFAAARWMIERLTNRLADGLVANLLSLTVGGFAGLLAYRVLSVFVALGSTEGVKRPRASLFAAGGWLYWVVGLIPGLIASATLLLAGLIGAPGHLIRGSRAITIGGLASALPLRLWSLQVIAGLLGISMKAAPDDSAASEWVGDKNGRARVVAADVRRAMLIIVVAWLMIILLLGAILLRALA